MNLKKFGLFASYAYYPVGGMWDFQGDFDTVEEARLYVAEVAPDGEKFDWYQIVDLTTMSIIEAVGNSCYGEAKIFDAPQDQ